MVFHGLSKTTLLLADQPSSSSSSSSSNSSSSSSIFWLLMITHTGEPLPVTVPPPTTTPEPTTASTTQQSTTPKAKVPEKPENVVARALSDTEIELSWSPPSVPNGKILEYKSIYFELVNEGEQHILTLFSLVFLWILAPVVNIA